MPIVSYVLRGLAKIYYEDVIKRKKENIEKAENLLILDNEDNLKCNSKINEDLKSFKSEEDEYNNDNDKDKEKNNTNYFSNNLGVNKNKKNYYKKNSNMNKNKNKAENINIIINTNKESKNNNSTNTNSNINVLKTINNNKLTSEYNLENKKKIRDVILAAVKKTFEGNRTFCENYSKKLNNFINSISLKLNELVIHDIYLSNTKIKQKIYFELLKILSDKGADYLRFESLFIILRLIDSDLIRNSYTPESILVTYFRESYYKCPVNFKNFYDFPLLLENE